jgi:hypothetical protein
MSSRPRKDEQGPPQALLAQPPVDVPTQEKIRQRAYELFCKREQSPGDPVRDWLDAERELRGDPFVAAVTPRTA